MKNRMYDIKSSEVTFVIQGSILDTTKKNILLLKKHFPNSFLILSTWESEQIPVFKNLVDLVIINDDPGSNSIGFSNKKNQYRYVNSNRQIISSYHGLCHVKTKYAVKIRSDCTLISNYILKKNNYNIYNDKYKIFKERIITSNNYAFYELNSIPIPFNISDFFMFGLTEDLITLWNIELFSNFTLSQSNKKTKGYLHKNSPFIQLHIEQAIWLKCLNKFKKINPVQKLSINKNIIKESNHYLVNNIIIYSANTLGLNTPERHVQATKSKFGDKIFNHKKWQQLYNQLILNKKNKIKISELTLNFLYKLSLKSLKIRFKVILITLLNKGKSSNPTEF